MVQLRRWPGWKLKKQRTCSTTWGYRCNNINLFYLSTLFHCNHKSLQHILESFAPDFNAYIFSHPHCSHFSYAVYRCLNSSIHLVFGSTEITFSFNGQPSHSYVIRVVSFLHVLTLLSLCRVHFLLGILLVAYFVAGH